MSACIFHGVAIGPDITKKTRPVIVRSQPNCFGVVLMFFLISFLDVVQFPPPPKVVPKAILRDVLDVVLDVFLDVILHAILDVFLEAVLKFFLKVIPKVFLKDVPKEVLNVIPLSSPRFYLLKVTLFNYFYGVSGFIYKLLN